MATDDVVDRIRKLFRLAENAGATEGEAAAALERANALLIRHNLTLDAIAVSAGEQPSITERRVRTGWAGSWRGSLLGILAQHNLCSSIISRLGRVDTVIVVGRPANVQATHAMYGWIGTTGSPPSSNASLSTSGQCSIASSAPPPELPPACRGVRPARTGRQPPACAGVYGASAALVRCCPNGR